MDRLLSLTVAVSLAFLIFLYSRSREQETLDNVPLAVEVFVTPRQAERYTLELTGTRQVTVSFTGPVQRIRELQMLLQRKELQVVKRITVPDDRLNDSRIADWVAIEASDINAPVGVTPIVSEGRNQIQYILHKLVDRRLPVRFDCLQEGVTGPFILDPPSVVVSGPQDVLERAQFIKTQPAEVPSRPANAAPNVGAAGPVPVRQELEGRAVKVEPRVVMVRVPSQAKRVYELTEVQVQFLCPPNFHLRPKFIDEHSGKVSLKVIGPAQDEAPKVHAFVDLGKGKFVSGLNHEPLQIQLPRDFQLAQDAPRVVAFELLPGDFVPDGLGMPSPPEPIKPGATRIPPE